MKNEKVQLGLVGAGAARAMYGPGLPYISSVSLVAAADPSSEARTSAQRELGVPNVYESVGAMLADAPLDAVLIASPPFCHLEHVLGAAKAGLHVIIEKPMARTPAESMEMIKSCRSAGVLLMVAFNRRLLPPLWTATQMIKSGDLGDVFHMETIWTHWGMTADAGWRDSFQCLGGSFQDHASHTVDLAQQWLGQVLTVYAQAHCKGPSVGRAREVEDHMSALMTHEGGGTSLHVHSRDCHRPISEFYRIYGTKGTLELEYTGAWAFIAPDNWEMRLYREGNPFPQRLVSRRPGNELLSELPDGHYAFYSELKMFAEAVRSQATTISPSGEDGLSVVRAISAAFLSASEGEALDVREGDRFDEQAFRGFLRSCSGR